MDVRVGGGWWSWAGIVVLMLVVPYAATGQAVQPAAETTAVAWQLLVDGDERVFQPDAESLDSLSSVARAAVHTVQSSGHYFATLDSAAVDTVADGPRVRLYVDAGPSVPVGRIVLEGVVALDSISLRRSMETRTGRPLDPVELETDVNVLLERYEAAGYPLAQVYVDDVRLYGDPPRLAVQLRVDEGEQLRLAGLRLSGATRTRPDYVMRLVGLEAGTPLTGYSAADVRQRIAGTGFFEEVGEPELHIDNDGHVLMVVPVEERPPGTFDLVLGYQPDPGGGGQLVGSGHLLLRNLFGGGRTGDLRLQRLPGHASRAHARLVDPFLLGLPFGIEAAFSGVQQDSSYNQLEYRVALSYAFDAELRASVSLSREVTQPGVAGARLDARTGEQRVPRSDAFFAGVGFRYEQLDRLINPRRGYVFDTRVERGRKERYARRRTAEGDTTAATRVVQQERLTAEVRAYVPVTRRQVLALGLDGHLLRADTYDRSDLVRFGGATTLRGYDEERFLARIAGRAFVEYRYLLERRTYAYAFVDLGYVQRPEMAELEALDGVFPGYGIGMQFETPLGLVDASYAVNPEDHLAQGRVHAGLSFGL